MEKWQKDFLEKYKEKEIEIKPAAIEIQSGKMKTKSLYSFYIKLGILYISFDTRTYITVENVKITMEYWEEFAIQGKYQMIIVDPQNVFWKKEQFHKLGYHVIPDVLDETLSKGRFFKQLAKGSQKQITKKFKAIIDVLKEKKERETFFVYEFDKKISLSNINIYYKGYYGTVNTKYENGYLSFYFEEKKYELKNNEDIKIAIDTILEKAKNKMRIKNHFQTPRYFFDIKISLLGYSNEIQNSIHQFLLEIYPWEEIERYFYEVSEKELKEKMTNKFSEPKVHKIMNHYFIIENEVNGFLEKNKALEKYKQIMMEKAAKEAEERFNKIFN